MEILVIGYGAMGSAIAKGLSTNVKEDEESHNLTIVEQNEEAVKDISYSVFSNISDVSNIDFEAVIIAIKPNDIQRALKDLLNIVKNTTLVISIAAGITTSNIEATLRENPIVRVMPPASVEQHHLAAVVGESVSAICGGTRADEEHIKTADALFASIGKTVIVKEDQINTVTAISGSGPAYFYLLTEYLFKAGIEKGLDEQTSRTLAEQTLIGAAKTLKDQSENVEELRAKVTSKGGTTQAAIESFEIDEFNKIVRSAVNAAQNRADELNETSRIK